MIVSHSHSFVFVAVPKTGSQSVRLALRPHLGLHDWEQCGLFERKRFPVPALAALGHGHISCRQLRPFLLPQMWQRYRKFAFVRDPFERFRSLLRFWFGAATEPPRTLDPFKRILSDASLRAHPLVQPQAHFLCDEDGQLLVDELGHFAALDPEFRRIARTLAIPAVSLPIRNASPVPADELPFDDELQDMIAELYRNDFKLLGLRLQAASAA